MRKRLLSALLAMAMILTLLPVSAFAAEGTWSDDGVYEWYYAQLDDTQKTMYGFLKENLKPVGEYGDWDVQCTLSDEMRNVGSTGYEGWAVNFYTAYHALERDHPEWSWISTQNYEIENANGKDATGEKMDKGGYWNVGARFNLNNPMIDAWEYSANFDSAVETAVTEISGDIEIGELVSNCDKAKAIHDYLCKLVTFGSDLTQYATCDETAFYALTGSPSMGDSNYNRATSEGYAAAFKLLCDKFHIPCVRVSGAYTEYVYREEEVHGWNLVQLDDGRWYGVDCAADDLGDSAAYDFFAVGSGTLINDSAFSTSHTVVNQWAKDTTSFRLTTSLPNYPTISTTAYGVTPAPDTTTATTLATSVNTVTYGDSITLTATVTGGGAPVTTGTVYFLRNGDEALGQVPVNNGKAELTLHEKCPVGTQSFRADFVPGGDDWLESTSNEVTVTVTPKTVSITGLRAEDRPYDTTKNVNLTGGRLDGVVSGDQVEAVMPSTGTIASPNASDVPYAVTVTLPALTGADAGNYTLAEITGVTVTISKAEPVVGTVSVDGTVYDTTSPSAVKLTRSGDGLTAGTVALDESVTFKAGEGSYPWTFKPTDTTNYKTAAGTVSITVSTRELAGITVSGTPSRTAYPYGAPFEPAGLTITATYSDGETEPIPVTDPRVTYSKLGDASEDAQTVTVTFLGKTATVGNIIVQPKPLSVSGFRWDTTGSPFTYDGAEKSVTTAGSYPEELEMTATNRTAVNAGDYTVTAEFALREGLKPGNYDLTAVKAVTAEWSIKPAQLSGQNVSRSVKFSNTQEQTVTAAEFGITKEGVFALKGDVTDAGKVLAEHYPDCRGSVKFKLAEGVAFDSQTVTIPLTFTPGDTNFAPVDVTLTITLTDKNIPTLTASGFTKTYDGVAVKAGDIKKTASINGTWAFKDGAAPVNVSDSGTYTLVFTPTDDGYAGAEVNVSISITKATPTGTPRYSRITAAGKTLKDANLSAEGMTPGGGTIQWLDSSTGAVLPDNTVVTARTSYRWLYTPSDVENYNTATGTVVLYTPSGGGSGSGSGIVQPTTNPNTNTSSTNTATTASSTNVAPTTVVSNGSATASLSTDDGQKLVNAAARGSGNVSVTVRPSNGAAVNSATASLPTETLSNLGYRTNADLTVSTPLGSVILPNAVLGALGSSTGTVEVSVAKNTDQSVTVSVTKNGQRVGLAADIRVSIPVDSAAARAGSGLVAVQVDAYGRQTILPKSSLSGNNQMNVLLDSGNTTLRFIDNSKNFNDMGSHWAASAVDFVSSRNLFQGTTPTTFEPNAPMTRAMLVTVLHRLESEPGAGLYSFSDVSPDAYYAEATAWAVSMGITNGDGSSFNGDGQISREMLATMLYRYAQRIAAGKGTFVNYSGMGGAGQVHDWADEAMRWAVGSGIITGDNGNLRPGDPASRAEVATMLVRFVNLITQ